MPPVATEEHSHAKPLSSGLVMLIAANIGNAANFLFQILMGRMLGRGHFAEFGVMNTMLGIFGLFAIPAGAIQLAIARQTAIFVETGDTDSISAMLLRASRRLAIVSIGVIVVLLVLTPWLKNYLHLDDATPIFVTIGLIVTMVIGQVGFGALQGLKRFGWLSVANIGSPLMRIVCGVFLVWLGWKATGALLGTLAGNLAFFVVCMAGLSGYLRRTVPLHSIDTSVVYRYLGPTLISLVAYAGLVNLDMVIVKHYFSAGEAAQYSAANRFGQSIGWLITPLCTVLFPHVWDEARHEHHRGLLLKFLLAAVAIGVGAACVCSLTGGFLTKLMLGRSDAMVTWLIPRYAWAMLPIGVANVFLNFVMARGKYGFLAGFVAMVVLYLGAFALWHDTFGQVLIVVATFGATTLGFLFFLTYGAWRAKE